MLTPPSLAQRSRELLLGADVARLAVRSPSLRSLPRGVGAPVVLIPGTGATDASMAPLRRLLVWLGHDARPAGLGRITSNVPTLHPRVTALARSIRTETGRAPTLIGWSIGGVLAREAAREDPTIAQRVITMGTPVVGGPKYTALARLFPAAQVDEIERLVAARNRTLIRLPVTAIWSPNDGVVTPEACIDEHTPDVEHVRVSSTHIGMGLDPDVWAAIARRLPTVD